MEQNPFVNYDPAEDQPANKIANSTLEAAGVQIEKKSLDIIANNIVDLKREYNKEYQFLDKYQRTTVDVDINSNIRCIANAGCCNKDTEIFFGVSELTEEATAVFNTLPIDKLFLKFRKGRYSLTDQCIFVQSLIERDKTKIKLQRIKDIVQSGVKETFNLILENKYEIWLTKDHLVMTDKGYVALLFLRKGDLVGIKSFDNDNMCFSAVREVMTQSVEGMTYDIICKDPNRNFIANSIVIHNSGKTRVLIMKSLDMVINQRINPTKIVLITFTNKAANEIKSRFIEFFSRVLPESNLKSLNTPHMSTIHSFGYAVSFAMGMRHKSILNVYKNSKIIKSSLLKVTDLSKITRIETMEFLEAYEKMIARGELCFAVTPIISKTGELVSIKTCFEEPDVEHVKAQEFLDRLSWATIDFRKQGVDVDDIDFDSNLDLEFKQDCIKYYAEQAKLGAEVFVNVCKEYLIQKYRTASLSFDDMAAYPILMIASQPEVLPTIWDKWEHIMMDEAQDTDWCQMSLALLCSGKENVDAFMGKKFIANLIST